MLPFLVSFECLLISDNEMHLSRGFFGGTAVSHVLGFTYFQWRVFE